ncbi:hypothetical protein LMG3458_01756 [Achromobacter deleyi]|uniref:Uncharacterized protein n=1 Tax=Achromobacter deleyi TaxID=1353891 RepID=A0A6S6ZMJ4_9BURK|nr:hypothetical protein LMG3458_01756 [Achromobacter deleyi]CAB3923493.1 hypothetical protein LMG3482_05623 [Achromobacter deleyi]CAB3924556.1 hypothetical protein LMG3481_05673 [Achromobacter deleyi]
MKMFLKIFIFYQIANLISIGLFKTFFIKFFVYVFRTRIIIRID